MSKAAHGYIKNGPQTKTARKSSQNWNEGQKFCGPFLTKLWAILDVTVGRFGHPRGPFYTWTMGRFSHFPLTQVNAMKQVYMYMFQVMLLWDQWSQVVLMQPLMTQSLHERLHSLLYFHDIRSSSDRLTPLLEPLLVSWYSTQMCWYPAERTSSKSPPFTNVCGYYVMWYLTVSNVVICDFTIELAYFVKVSALHKHMWP